MIEKNQIQNSSSTWNLAADLFNDGIMESARKRFSAMTDQDILRFKQLNQMDGGTDQHVLQKLIDTGSFRGISLKMTPGYGVSGDGILDKIANEKSADIFKTNNPAKSFGKPWVELFYECLKGEEVECFVSVFGLGRREQDLIDKVWLLEINDGLWECNGATQNGLSLISIDQKWTGGSRDDRLALWPKVCALMEGDISFNLRYGQWEESFGLRLRLQKGLDVKTALSALRTPSSPSVFKMNRHEDRFPFSWVICRL